MLKAPKINHKTCMKLRFIDSYKFLTLSLDKLASYLSKDKLRIMNVNFVIYQQKISICSRKDIFPYEYIDCVEKLEETELPPRE